MFLCETVLGRPFVTLVSKERDLMEKLSSLCWFSCPHVGQLVVRRPLSIVDSVEEKNGRCIS